MKTLKIKKLVIIMLTFIAFTSCSKDDDSNENTNFENVPSGEIVELALRAKVLTGYNNANPNSKNNEQQKWWKHKKSSLSYNDSCGVEDEEYVQENTYFAFYPTGEIYVKEGANGEPTNSNYTWSWVNSATKNKIYFQGNELTFTELWDSRLVIAGYFSEGNCSATSYEEFTNF